MFKTRRLPLTRFIFCVLLFHPWLCDAQPPPLRWLQTFSTEYDDEGRSIATDGDGGFVVAGGHVNPYINRGVLYCVHLAGDGSLVWQRDYEYGLLTKAKDVERIAGDGYIVTGYFVDDHGTADDALVLRLDDAGEPRWTWTLRDSADDVGWRSRMVADGFMVCGVTASTPSGHKDAFLAKLDFDGNQLWYRRYGGEYSDRTTAMVVLPDGGVALAGLTRDPPELAENGWLLRTDSAGEPLWSQQYGGELEDEFYWIERAPGGGFVMCGRSRSNPDREDSDTWLVTADENGEQTGSWIFANLEGDDWAQMVRIVPAGYILVGSSYHFATRSQASILRVSRQGEVVYSGEYGGGFDDMAFAVTVLPDGGYIMAGHLTLAAGRGTDVAIARTFPDPLNLELPNEMR